MPIIPTTPSFTIPSSTTPSTVSLNGSSSSLQQLQALLLKLPTVPTTPPVQPPVVPSEEAVKSMTFSVTSSTTNLNSLNAQLPILQQAFNTAKTALTNGIQTVNKDNALKSGGLLQNYNKAYDALLKINKDIANQTSALNASTTKLNELKSNPDLASRYYAYTKNTSVLKPEDSAIFRAEASRDVFARNLESDKAEIAFIQGMSTESTNLRNLAKAKGLDWFSIAVMNGSEWEGDLSQAQSFQTSTAKNLKTYSDKLTAYKTNPALAASDAKTKQTDSLNRLSGAFNSLVTSTDATTKAKATADLATVTGLLNNPTRNFGDTEKAINALSGKLDQRSSYSNGKMSTTYSYRPEFRFLG
ncbi:MAG: hypothetical protein HEQ32_00840 [Vampirovibrio sp.]